MFVFHVSCIDNRPSGAGRHLQLEAVAKAESDEALAVAKAMRMEG
jgi:hypothetical protein